MSDKSDLRKQIYENMQAKSTKELMEIWEENDHKAWSDTAFDVVKKILKQRTGNVPRRSKLSKKEKVKPQENEQITYYDLGNVEKVASLADIAAWVLLIGYIVDWVMTVYRSSFGENLQNLQVLVTNVALVGIVRILSGIYLFVILKAIAQGIYILMDIEENTHAFSQLAKSRHKG